MSSVVPRIVQTVLDATDVRALAEFYRELFGLEYRPGDEIPAEGQPDSREWLVLRAPDSAVQLAFQQVDVLAVSTWPDDTVPQQLHLDTVVADLDALERAKDRAVALGGTVRLDRTGDPEEPLYVIADPAGHPLCIFVG